MWKSGLYVVVLVTLLAVGVFALACWYHAHFGGGGWGDPNNGLRCRIIPSRTSLAAGERLDFELHLRNVSDKPITILNRVGVNTDFYMNGRLAPQEQGLLFSVFLTGTARDLEYVAVRPGGTAVAKFSFGRLKTSTFSLIDEDVIDTTEQPGTYGVQATYCEFRDSNHAGWWKGMVRSRQVTLNVSPR